MEEEDLILLTHMVEVVAEVKPLKKILKRKSQRSTKEKEEKAKEAKEKAAKEKAAKAKEEVAKEAVAKVVKLPKISTFLTPSTKSGTVTRDTEAMADTVAMVVKIHLVFPVISMMFGTLKKDMENTKAMELTEENTTVVTEESTEVMVESTAEATEENMAEAMEESMAEEAMEESMEEAMVDMVVDTADMEEKLPSTTSTLRNTNLRRSTRRMEVEAKEKAEVVVVKLPSSLISQIPSIQSGTMDTNIVMEVTEVMVDTVATEDMEEKTLSEISGLSTKIPNLTTTPMVDTEDTEATEATEAMEVTVDMEVKPL